VLAHPKQPSTNPISFRFLMYWCDFNRDCSSRCRMHPNILFWLIDCLKRRGLLTRGEFTFLFQTTKVPCLDVSVRLQVLSGVFQTPWMHIQKVFVCVGVCWCLCVFQTSFLDPYSHFVCETQRVLVCVCVCVCVFQTLCMHIQKVCISKRATECACACVCVRACAYVCVCVCVVVCV